MPKQEAENGVDSLIEPLPWWARIFASVVPTHSASERRQYNWRLRIAFVACVGFVASGFLLAAYNQIPQVNDIVRESELRAHIATENDKNAQQDRRDEVLADEAHQQWAAQLDAQIIQFRKDQCRLLTLKNREAASGVFEKIRDRMAQYFHITGQQYSLPSCEDI